MNKNLLEFDLEKEKKKIVYFIKETLRKQKKEKVVIGVSGGVDSVTCLYLLKEAIGEKNIFILNMPYFSWQSEIIKELFLTNTLFKKQMSIVSIRFNCRFD